MPVFHTSDLVRQIQERIQNICANIIGPPDTQTLTHILQAMFTTFQNQSALRSFNFDPIEFVPTRPLRTVDCLSPTAQPGDLLVVNERYSGIIVSCDGTGKGVILSQPNNGEGTIKVSCRVQSFSVVDYVSFEVIVDV